MNREEDLEAKVKSLYTKHQDLESAASVLEDLATDRLLTYLKVVKAMDSLRYDRRRHEAMSAMLSEFESRGCFFPSEVHPLLCEWLGDARAQIGRIVQDMADAYYVLIERQAALMPGPEAICAMPRTELNALLTKDWAQAKAKVLGLSHHPAMPIRDLRRLAECLRGQANQSQDQRG